jgi:hypothetical protein
MASPFPTRSIAWSRPNSLGNLVACVSLKVQLDDLVFDAGHKPQPFSICFKKFCADILAAL